MWQLLAAVCLPAPSCVRQLLARFGSPPTPHCYLPLV